MLDCCAIYDVLTYVYIAMLGILCAYGCLRISKDLNSDVGI